MSAITISKKWDEQKLEDLASQFSACIKAKKYSLAGDLLLYQKYFPLKFIINKCFVPILAKDFIKERNAKPFFIWLTSACGNIIIPRLFIAALGNKAAFAYVLELSEEVYKNTKVIQKCFRNIIKYGCVAHCRMLIKKLSEKNISIQPILVSSTKEQPPIFLETIWQKQWEIFQAFIRAVPTLDSCFSYGNTFGNTLLHEICKGGFIVPLYKLLSHMGESARRVINLENGEKITSLMYSIEAGNPEFVACLIGNGADFTQACEGVTPIQYAKSIKDEQIISLLSQAMLGDFDVAEDILKDSELGKQIRYRKEEGIKLCIAEFINGKDISVNHVRISKIIRSGWIDPNLVIDKEGNTLACFAAQYDLIDIAQLLVDQKADFSIANSELKTPAMLAAKYGSLHVLLLLIEQVPQYFIHKESQQSRSALEYMFETLITFKEEAEKQHQKGFKEGQQAQLKKSVYSINGRNK